MFAEERRRKIVEYLKEKGKITVKELSRIFKTSEVTIRKDLEILESIGELIRTHGGAILPHGTRAEWDFFKKMSQHRKEKEEIAKRAVSLLKEGETIILDSGTTPYYIAKTIKGSTVCHSLGRSRWSSLRRYMWIKPSLERQDFQRRVS